MSVSRPLRLAGSCAFTAALGYRSGYEFWDERFGIWVQGSGFRVQGVFTAALPSVSVALNVVIQESMNLKYEPASAQ